MVKRLHTYHYTCPRCGPVHSEDIIRPRDELWCSCGSTIEVMGGQKKPHIDEITPWWTNIPPKGKKNAIQIKPEESQTDTRKEIKPLGIQIIIPDGSES